MKKEEAAKLLILLKREYPDIRGTVLNYGNALELLIATMLSARCTDEKVNEVTRVLFKKYKTVKDYAEANLLELQEIIKPTGFYRVKAKHIKAASKKLLEDFNSNLPSSVAKLTKLPGVARKTANIVISNAFNLNEGVAVDTHVMRLARKLGLSNEKDRDKIEKDLMNLFLKHQWADVTNLLIAHGRKVCSAKRPKYHECILNELCPSACTDTSVRS